MNVQPIAVEPTTTELAYANLVGRLVKRRALEYEGFRRALPSLIESVVAKTNREVWAVPLDFVDPVGVMSEAGDKYGPAVIVEYDFGESAKVIDFCVVCWRNAKEHGSKAMGVAFDEPKKWWIEQGAWLEEYFSDEAEEMRKRIPRHPIISDAKHVFVD